jgi:hypothetical protein
VSAGEDPGRKDREREAKRLGPLPRPVALLVLVAWASLTIAAAIGLLTTPTIWSGAGEGLVPHEHRTSSVRPLALLRFDAAQADATSEQAELEVRAVLAEAGFAIEEALGPERIPLAPPRTEITRWLDAHALYLLPLDAHEHLAERLSDARMLAEVRGLEARLSSPLFAVSGEQPRRDPLGIHELTVSESGRFGHVTEVPGGSRPQVGPNGDLVAARGDRALVALRSDRPPAELLVDLRAAVEGLPVTVALVDRRTAEATLAEQLGAGAKHGRNATLAGFAALLLLLAVTLRRLVPVLMLGLCLASIWLLTMFALVRFELVGGGVDPASLALVLVVLGFGCDAALRQPAVGARDWASTLVLAAALLPLLLVPYPLWQRWALLWAGAILLTAAIMRGVLPVVLALTRGDLDWRRPGFRLAPMPVFAVVICVALTAAGAWASRQLDYRPGTRLPSTSAEARNLERELTEHFFDPTMIVEARTRAEAAGDEPGDFSGDFSLGAAALDAAAADVARLAELVPHEARRIDSPASFVLPRAELEARKRGLEALKLHERMAALDLLLVDQGLRAEAFAEFVRGAADIDDLPSAQAAIDGPLGPWIAGYLDLTGEQVELRTIVELHGREGLAAAALTRERLAELPVLRGPAIAAALDRHEFDNRLGLVVLCGLWLCAFLVWLGTGRFGVAIAVAVVALAGECGVLLGLTLLGQPIGPHLLPVMLLVGAGAAVAGARACRAVSLGQPIVARGLLLAGACVVVVGMMLWVSAQPLWRELGVALAGGSALACGLGLFATPGLVGVLRRSGAAPDKGRDA